MTTRRSILTGFASLLAAPAIVRVASLMPAKSYQSAVDFVTTKGFCVGDVIHITGLEPKGYWSFIGPKRSFTITSIITADA